MLLRAPSVVAGVVPEALVAGAMPAPEVALVRTVATGVREVGATPHQLGPSPTLQRRSLPTADVALLRITLKATTRGGGWAVSLHIAAGASPLGPVTGGVWQVLTESDGATSGFHT